MNRLLVHQPSSVTSAAFLLGGIGMASLVLGFFRNTLLAVYFGAGDELDIYFASFRVPDIFFNFFFLGALSAGFIPIFSSYWSRGEKKQAWRLTSDILNTALFIFAFIALILILIAPFVMPFVVPGFSEEKLRFTVFLTRLMLLQPIILAVSNVFSGVLQSLRYFFIYALTPVVYNFGIIIGIVAFTPFFGLSGLGLGVILGALLHAAVQIPTLIRSGYRYTWVWDMHLPGFRKVLSLMIPRSLTLIMSQINLLIITIIASVIGEGKLAVFNFAYEFQGFPIRLIAASFAVAAFPTIARLAEENLPLFGDTVTKTIRQIGFYLIPASALFFILRAQIVRVVLGYGKFAEDWDATSWTAETLGILAFGILAQGLHLLIIRAFFALHDSKTPLYIGFVSTLANIFLSYYLVLVYSWGLAGLAFAFILSNTFQTALLIFILKKRISAFFSLRAILNGYVCFSVGGFIAALSTFGALYFLAEPVGTHTVFGILSQGLIAGAAGIGTYLLAMVLMRVPEANEFFTTLKRGFHKIPLPGIINGEPSR